MPAPPAASSAQLRDPLAEEPAKALGVLAGLGVQGYVLALRWIAEHAPPSA